jgi:hypothetical protein
MQTLPEALLAILRAHPPQHRAEALGQVVAEFQADHPDHIAILRSAVDRWTSLRRRESAARQIGAGEVA